LLLFMQENPVEFLFLWNPKVFLGSWIWNSLWTFMICRLEWWFSVSLEGVAPAAGYSWDGPSSELQAALDAGACRCCWCSKGP